MRISGRLVSGSFAGALLFGVATLRAEDLFDRPEIIPLSARPTALEIADLDGDGLLDLAACLSSSGEVVVLLNRPDDAPRALLADPRSYATGLSPLALVAGDLDGSGLPDLLAVNSGSSSVSLLFDRGDGTFGAATHRAVGADPRVARLADLEGDGDLDAVVGRVGSRDLVVLLGDGKGGFRAGARPQVGGNPHALLAADLDGDGVPDIAAIHANGLDGGASFLRGRGDGTFRERVATDLTPADDLVPRFLAPGDFDGDGLAELAVLTDQERLLLLDLRPNGVFTVDGIAAVPLSPARPIAAADLDADGRPDVVTLIERRGEFGIRPLLGRGDGTFAPGSDAFLPGPQRDIALADLDLDGVLDLVGAEEEPRGILVATGSSPGHLGLRGSIFLGAAPRALAAWDLDGDGALEVIAASSRAIHVVRTDGGQALDPPSEELLGGRSIEDMLVADLDGDGEPEAVLSDIASEEVLVAPLAGSGEVGRLVEHGLRDLPGRLAAADFDGDGTVDVAVAQPGSSRLVLILEPKAEGSVGRGDGYVEVAVDAGQTAVHAADADGDGVADIIAGTADGLFLLLGDGSGGFPRRRSIPGHARPRAIRAADIDGDGVPEVLAAVGERVVVLEGAASPAGPEVDAMDLDETIEALEARDVDRDGAVDIVAAAGRSVLALRGLRGGGFRAPEEHRVGFSPRAIVLADIDLDGRTDCATADFGSQAISLLRGASAGPAGPFRRGDADGDGGVRLTDPIVLLEALFEGGRPLACADSGDANDDGRASVTDAVFLLDYLFRGGPAPPPPGPLDCGLDPTRDGSTECENAGCR